MRRSSSRGYSHAQPASVAVSFSAAPIFQEHAPTRPSPLAMNAQNGMPLEIWDRLRSFPLFADAPDGFLTAISKKLRPQFYSKQDYILTEGDDARAMYWIVRGAVGVTSRDGESVYAELSAGAFFGEIGILFNRPRTASVIARTKCMVVVLTADALNLVLPQFSSIEQAIREEAQERLSLLEKQKATETGPTKSDQSLSQPSISAPPITISPQLQPGPNLALSTILNETPFSGHALRDLLKELPLFTSLPPDVLHTLALSVEPRRYSPFEYILRQHYPGREIFFIVMGTVEVLDEDTQQVKARLSKGAHFGEVAYLSLAPTRTASIRSVTMVQCLLLTGTALDLVMEKYPSIKASIEQTARARMPSSSVATMESRVAEQIDIGMPTPSTANEDEDVEKPLDPDPFSHPNSYVDSVERNAATLTVPLISGSPLLSTDSLDRLSLVSLSSSENSNVSESSSALSASSSRSPSPSSIAAVATRIETAVKARRHSTRRQASLSADMLCSPKNHKRARRAEPPVAGALKDAVLVQIFRQLTLTDLMRAQRVCKQWQNLVLNSPLVLTTLNLAPYNTSIYDSEMKSIAKLVGSRPSVVDISNCFHITDEGFAHLVASIGRDIRIFRMKSVWEVSGMAIMELTVPMIAQTLEEIDLSNCRKVGDATLARLVGWVVPESSAVVPGAPPSGTIVGCPNLQRISLSYCKHITDKSMHHLAAHASSRIEALDLTRCTTITDVGFGYWASRPFTRLRRLCLADCTFLTDKAIVSLAAAAKSLEELDISFCCALSDVSVEVLSLGCPMLKSLNLAFCGSAVSDASLKSVARHLVELQTISVRGCVRVTNMGVDAIGRGCVNLSEVDLSQCRNVDINARPLGDMRVVNLPNEEYEEKRAGGSGKLKTYGYGTAIWKGRVKVTF
ncbi:hypothetical protein V1512DRAFT_247096 [Lipomyces arxii]|uniref:uncharacterized protein n=1 Tax=Lipomyces arxii TaxID=56418 RepID=UPI0034CFEDAE